MSKYRVKVKFSGVGTSMYHDGKMSVDYTYLLQNINEDQQNYLKTHPEILPADLLSRYNNQVVIGCSYQNDSQVEEGQQGLGFTPERGINTIVKNETDPVSIYKREYQEYERTAGYDENGKDIKEKETYLGSWEPVVINNTVPIVNDYNVKSDYSYQYIMYPVNATDWQVFANKEDNDEDNGSFYGDPIQTQWDFWTLCELIPQKLDIDAPIVKKAYKVDTSNIWMFKYNLETGAQTQNINKNEVQTLGQFSRISHGKNNNISGEVSCLLGSEIIPYMADNYIERLRKSWVAPLSTNERTKMLQQWRKIVYSKNPKLLRDIKGQAWIVSILSGSNTPHNFYRNQPDNISFSWKQIEDINNVIIYDNESNELTKKCVGVWSPVKKK